MSKILIKLVFIILGSICAIVMIYADGNIYYKEGNTDIGYIYDQGECTEGNIYHPSFRIHVADDRYIDFSINEENILVMTKHGNIEIEEAADIFLKSILDYINEYYVITKKE